MICRHWQLNYIPSWKQLTVIEFHIHIGNLGEGLPRDEVVWPRPATDRCWAVLVPVAEAVAP